MKAENPFTPALALPRRGGGNSMMVQAEAYFLLFVCFLAEALWGATAFPASCWYIFITAVASSRSQPL